MLTCGGLSSALQARVREGAVDDCLLAVSTALAKSEKILSTPIPLGYTRSSVRFLWIWITLLPFALSRTSQLLN